MDDSKSGTEDRFSIDRQNIETGSRLSPKEVARLCPGPDGKPLSPITIRLIHRQFHIGEKVDGRISFSVDDVDRIRKRQIHLHHHTEEDPVNMSKENSMRALFDPLSYKLFDSNRKRIELIERRLWDKQDPFSHWNQFSDLRKTLAAIAERLDKLEDLARRITDDENGSGRGEPVIGVSAPFSLDTGRAEALAA